MDMFLQEFKDFVTETVPVKDNSLVDGRFGKMSVIKHTPTQKMFMVKSISIKSYNEIETFVHQLMKDNMYFVNLYYSLTSLRGHLLIMDYIKGGDLFDLVLKERRLDEMEVKFIIGQLVDAVAALHKHKIVHNDIKMENILYNRYDQIYLCDYGLCKIAGTESCCDGTLEYFSPEKMSKMKYEMHFDCWAIGILVYELLTGKHPFKKHPDEEINLHTLKARQHNSINYFNMSMCAISFVESLLRYNINLRLTNINEIKEHNFIKKE
ncbi:Protein kinase-1 [Perigonia lusca single nucleopolyhedrovirus]|uniref:Protein kinase-1 n=1 Tax=Perigonia lusca single nucleopolyhedrovirus TaxID=1675865 RepID=A0A0M3WNS7_9ABAC|nr:Protein kinase-1 [Perigonia lusca single nucleopolyhedrovirus]AKN80548.1 Protein kinase-1 [Perigonia lusca single nucleopolyhedrovirus]